MAIIAKFALKESPSTQFIVATTHLLYNPRRDDIRLAQTQILLAELDRMAYRQINLRYRDRDPIPIIVTGDFNLQHFSESFRLINDGCVSLDCLHLKNRGILLPYELGITDNCQHFNVVQKDQRYATMLFNSERQKQQQQTPNQQNGGHTLLDYRTMRESRLPFNTGRLTHNLNLTSAIQRRTKDNRLAASTYHTQWITVDYIFYTKYRRQQRQPSSPLYTSLQLLEYLELPSVEECYENGPIPNAHIGSDHFSLAAKFVLYKHN